MATNLQDIEHKGVPGFDSERLARVREAVLADIEAGRCHGVSMIVAHHGEVVLGDRRVRRPGRGQGSAAGFGVCHDVGCKTIYQHARVVTG